jgi:IS5 family transposase
MSKPKHKKQSIRELFVAHFDHLLNQQEPLLVLARKIDWQRFELAFDSKFGEKGAPAKSTRLMVGLQYLKYTFYLSDEELIRRWPQNPYWQAFCGFKYMQHEPPIHPTTMEK